MEHVSTDREAEAHIASTASTLNDSISNILPSDAVDAISAFFNEDKLGDVEPKLENYGSYKASSIMTPSIDLNDYAKHTLPSDVTNIKIERMPIISDSIKQELPEGGIPIKTNGELLQQDDVQSDHLVYTTLDNVKSSDGISENSNLQHFQPIKHEPMFSTPNFNPQLQLRRYSCYPNNYTPGNYSGNSCPPVRTNLNQNYCSNNIQASPLRWMQGKQQVMVGTPSPRNIPTSLMFDIFSENEYASGSSSSSLLSSSVGDSSPNVQNIMPSNVNSWDIASSTPVVLGHDGKPMRHFQDPNGNIQYYESIMNDRESHNMKERERRARVTRICSRMRMVIPGVTETTDKATVFQRGAAYINFLLSKTGRRYDNIFMEKMNQRRSMGDSSGVEQNNDI